jgi:ribosome biogenesis GTPase / thiamine phosphate phosphatase
VCCLGRSGVGKSSIINALSGEERQATREVSRIGNKGRHTTSASRLLQLQPGMIIDTPGLRELQLWGDPEALEESFSDISELAAECRFADCRHQGEPGCAVQAAAASGLLPWQRLEHYLEQRDELAEAELRGRMSADAYEKKKWKQIARDIRRMMKQ